MRVVVFTLVVVACSRGTGDTPDAASDAAPDARTVEPLINEFMRKPPVGPGNEEAREFVEIKGAPMTDYSAYALLQVRGNGNASELGVIRTVHVVGTTSPDGYWDTGYVTDTFKNNTYTLLLVKGFSGSDQTDIDMDNDGVIDNEPWQAIVDSVAYQDDSGSGPTDFKYSTVVLLPGADGNNDEWEGASRVPDGTDTDTTGDWVRNDPDGAGLDDINGSEDPGDAISSRGKQNFVVQ